MEILYAATAMVVLLMLGLVAHTLNLRQVTYERNRRGLMDWKAGYLDGRARRKKWQHGIEYACGHHDGVETLSVVASINP